MLLQQLAELSNLLIVDVAQPLFLDDCVLAGATLHLQRQRTQHARPTRLFDGFPGALVGKRRKL